MQLRIFSLIQMQCNMISEIVLSAWTHYNKDKWFKEFQHANIASIQIVSENGLLQKHRKMSRGVHSAIKFWSHSKWKLQRKKMNKIIMSHLQPEEWAWITIQLLQVMEEQISMAQIKTRIKIKITKTIKMAIIDLQKK